MKKRIEEMIPLAISAIENYAEFKDGDGQIKPIPATYQGSISGMGASILQMGLLPTLAVFADQESGAKDDQRQHLLRIIRSVLENYANYGDKQLLIDHATEDLCKVAASRMSHSQRKNLREYLLDAAVAVKLSLRTFKLDRI